MDRREQAGELAQLAERLSERALPVSAAVYQLDERGFPSLVGSSVLALIGDIRFLITATHVLRLRQSGQLIIGVSPEVLPVAGDVTTLHAVGGKASDEDHIDVSVVRLVGEPWQSLSVSHFAAWEEFDILPPKAASHTFGVVGFPVSHNKAPVRGDRIRSVAYRMAALEGNDSFYRATGRDKQTNLVLGMERRDMWGPDGQRTAPDLNGVSGAGIWRYGRRLRNATAPARLSGILTEWHKRGRHRYVLGTRFDLVLAKLAEKYADVRAFVQSQITS
jgi:hypothetical protein